MSKWDEMGIAWVTESVKKQFGAHATDRRELPHGAEMPLILDLGLFRENVPNADAILCGIWDGTSARVQAQDVARHNLPKGIHGEALREAVWNRLIGSRVRGPVVKTYPVPGGTRYTGSDLAEYQRMVAAALVDQGVENSLALSIARTFAF